MRMVQQLLLVVVIVCALNLPARADDAAISPFVNDKTLVVVRFDVKTLDPAATLQFSRKHLLGRGDDPQRVAAIQNVWQQRTDNAQKLIKGLQKAGATNLYWLLSASDLSRDLSLPAVIGGTGKGVWIVPVGASADGATIAKLITANPNNAGKPVLQAQEIGNAVVAAKPGRQIDHDGAALSAEWVKALAANEPIVVASVPGEIIRRSFEENVPTVSTSNGSMPIKQFTHGVKWISISIDSQAVYVSGKIECTDAATASTIADFINSALQPMRGKPVRLLEYPFPPIENVAEIFACKAEGTEVRCTPAAEATVVLATKGLRDSLRERAVGNMRQILLGSIMYMNQHREFAPSLEVMLKEQEMSAEVMKDPLYPEEKPAWVYVKPLGMKTDADKVVIYEKADAGVIVGFADGHVEILANREQVLKRAAAAH